MTIKPLISELIQCERRRSDDLAAATTTKLVYCGDDATRIPEMDLPTPPALMCAKP
jgi:hypothetical protein